MNAAGPTKGHLNAFRRKSAEGDGICTVCGKPLPGRQRKAILFQNLLYVYSKTCDADP